MPTASVDKKVNPANAKEELSLPKGYRPLSSAVLRLEAPARAGYHRRWFRGTANRIQRALQAGYTFVDEGEVDLNNRDLAGDPKASGSTDLGSRVSVVSGDMIGENGQAGRMYLMECPLNLYEYARGLLEKQVDDIADALRGGSVGSGQNGETRNDVSKRYLKNGVVPSLFNKRT